MYKKPFYIDSPVGNNTFSSELRKGRKLFVPDIVKGRIADLKISQEIAFEEVNEEGEITSFNGLSNFIKTNIFGIPAIIFDNHNHALYFWFEEIIKENIDKINLIHIDEHSDLAVPLNNFIKYFGDNNIQELINKNGKEEFLQKIFEYTNFSLNVGNYIKPFLSTGIVEKFYKVTSESELDEINDYNNERFFTIFNLDIDFFSPAMEYIEYKKKKEIIRKIAKKSNFITIATSPFFIEQKKAIEIIKDIFKED